MAERMTLEILRLGAQADGVAESSAGSVFVAGALPGEVIECEIQSDRGRLVSVQRPSPQRIEPVCRHFGSCGGCAAQHMSPELYRGWKRDLVATAFRHRGLDVAVEELVGVGPHRRRRATFTARSNAGRLTLGFHEEGSHALVDLAVCPVVTPAIEAALPAFRSIASSILSSGETLRLAVTATAEGLDILLTDVQHSPDARAKAKIAEIARQAGIIRVMADGEIVMQSAKPVLALAGARVELPPGAFIQATAEAETAIAAILAEATRKSKRIADLFCGLGTFTFGLARHARVLALDSDRPAIAALTLAAKAVPGVKPIEARVRDLMREPMSRTEFADFDAVVLDPPRAGAKDQSEAIARSKVPVVCAVSCNPATLARDCRLLVDAGYAIERVVPVDQFVWSPHVEAVAILKRPRGK
jgi:23S rRNA (uracil1939-C5)-methyltransferase